MYFGVFQDATYRNRIAIFHYGGHANSYQLLLESPEGQAAPAYAGGLSIFLGQQQGLQLVFLNGCSTHQQTQGLLDANVSAVVSTSQAIDDDVAKDFACRFYQGLAGGAGIQTAYSEAEAALRTVKGEETRGLYRRGDDELDSGFTDRWPWDLYIREGAKHVATWNLPEAADNPLFGLPPLPEQDLPESPYRHLHWFTRQHAEVFFGRGHQIRELYDRVTAGGTPPIVLFYGQSGAGKSSVLDAGLIPRLEQIYEVRYLRRGQGGLLDTLRLAFLPEACDVAPEIAWQVKEEAHGKPLVVILDQVEEVYTRPDPKVSDELEQFLGFIKSTFGNVEKRPRGKLILGFRKEWLAELEKRLAECELPRTKVFLEPLDRRGILEVVGGPASSERLRQRFGLTVENGLAEVIADDLLADRESAIAPTLQILLSKLWAEATTANNDHPHFSQDLYQDLKRHGILLGDFLVQQIEAFREQFPQAADSGLLLDLLGLHTTSLGTAGQLTADQLRENYAHLGDTLPDIVQQCQDLHLLTVTTSPQKEGTKTTRLAHDTLAPLVREQLDESDKPGQRARRILDNRSVDWEGERKGTPLDEADLAVVEQGSAGTHELSPTEQRLLQASRGQRARRKRQRRYMQLGVVMAALAVVLSVWLWRTKSDEQQAMTLVGAVLTARADAVPYAIDNLRSLRELAMPILRERFRDSSLDLSQRLRAAFALAEFGEVEEEFLIDSIAQAREGECRNFVTALGHGSNAAQRRLNERIAQESDPITKARLAIVLLHVGDCRVAADLLEPASDPVLRTTFIHYVFPGWHGDLWETARVLETSKDSSLRAGLCLALGLTSEDRFSSIDMHTLRDVLLQLYLTAPDGPTHSAAAWTLRKWGAELPNWEPTNPDDERHWYINGQGITMLRLPAGTFTMGSNENYPDEKPPHQVTLTKSFWISDREVTVRQFQQFAHDKAYQNDHPAERPVDWVREVDKHKIFTPTEDCPANSVGWLDAIFFCNWLSRKAGKKPYYRKIGNQWGTDSGGVGFRLPTEAEWEYACRSSSNAAYCFGDDPSLLSSYVVLNGNRTIPTGSKLPNAWGLFDMHGSLWELCHDHFGGTYYERSPPADPMGPAKGSYRVLRGGSFFDFARLTRSANRHKTVESVKPSVIGFRVAALHTSE